GVLSIIFLPLLLQIIYYSQRRFGLPEGPMSLAVFHSLFIAMGVMIFLPFLRPYAARIERILPERGDSMTRYLDKTLLNLPSVALEAVVRGLRECRSLLAGAAAGRLRNTTSAPEAARISENVGRGLSALRRYLSPIELEPEDPTMESRRISDVHIMDHLQRLAVLVPSPDTHPGTSRLASWEDRLGRVLDQYAAKSTDESATTEETSTDGVMMALSQEMADWR